MGPGLPHSKLNHADVQCMVDPAGEQRYIFPIIYTPQGQVTNKRSKSDVCGVVQNLRDEVSLEEPIGCN